MANARYVCLTGADVALGAAVAKSILGVKAHANSGLRLCHWTVTFDGVVAADESVVVELCAATFATNSPGTASTSVTPVQVGGRVLTAGFTAARTWTTEPTVLTVIRERLLTPDSGLLIEDWPLGTEFDCALAEGWVIRCTAPNAVNARGTFEVERN